MTDEQLKTREAADARVVKAKKAEDRAIEGRKAMKDYERQGEATREKTARLKALRLAKEAEDAATVAAAEPAAPKKRTRAKAKAV